jgi:hypothetical protein
MALVCRLDILVRLVKQATGNVQHGSLSVSFSLGSVTSRIEQRSCVGERKRLDLSDYPDGNNDMSITSVACLYSELK